MASPHRGIAQLVEQRSPKPQVECSSHSALAILGCGQAVKAPVSDTGIVGSNPAAPANMESEPGRSGDRPLSGSY